MMTKMKVRGVLHLAGLVIVAVACLWVWFTDAVSLTLTEKFIATGVLATTLATKWDEVVMSRATKYVETLNIPETETTTTTTTTTDKGEA